MAYKRNLLIAGAAVALVAATPAALDGVRSQERAAARELAAAPATAAGPSSRHFDRTIATATSFGPNVRQGVFLGESAAVSSLPGPTIAPVKSLVTRDFENLGHGAAP